MITFVNCILAFACFFVGVVFLAFLIREYPLAFYHEFLRDAIIRKGRRAMAELLEEMMVDDLGEIRKGE